MLVPRWEVAWGLAAVWLKDPAPLPRLGAVNCMLRPSSLSAPTSPILAQYGPRARPRVRDCGCLSRLDAEPIGEAKGPRARDPIHP